MRNVYGHVVIMYLQTLLIELVCQVCSYVPSELLCSGCILFFNLINMTMNQIYLCDSNFVLTQTDL